MRDVSRVHRVVAELLTDVQRRRAWRSNPAAYAEDMVDGAGAEVIAGLDPDRLEAAALNFDFRRVTSPTAPDSQLNGRVTDPSRNVDRWPVLDGPRIGLGFWPDLFVNFEESGLVEVWEHRVDEYLTDTRLLDELASIAPVSMHSVGLSLGSTEGTADLGRLERVGQVLRTAGVDEFSDHLAFSQIGDIAVEHFIPVWRVEEALGVVVENVNRVQDILGVRLALENIAPIVDLGGELTVSEFLNAVIDRTGCGVLLDITNMTLCEANGFCDTAAELEMLNLEAVVVVHVAGGDAVGSHHFDAHAFPVAQRDLRLLAELSGRMPNCRSVIVERDGRRGKVSEVEADLRAVHAALG